MTLNSAIRKKKIIGYTAGVFDLFHIGHLNLLKRAKRLCDILIVGVTVDEVVVHKKNKKAIIPFAERMKIVKSIKYVDKVLPQVDLDKYRAWEKLRYDILFVGSDWRGNKIWREYEYKLRKVGVQVKYFPYTKNTSSTKLKYLINKLLNE